MLDLYNSCKRLPSMIVRPSRTTGKVLTIIPSLTLHGTILGWYHTYNPWMHVSASTLSEGIVPTRDNPRIVQHKPTIIEEQSLLLY